MAAPKQLNQLELNQGEDKDRLDSQEAGSEGFTNNPISGDIEAKDSNAQSETVGNNNYSRVGQKLAEAMEEQGYHPVIIFGSANSGKSTLLGSLLSYLQIDTTKGVGVYLGEPLIPQSSGYGRDAKEFAETFFYKSVQEFLDGVGHAATQVRVPFFIPVIIKPQNLPEKRFAFMESNGEWYLPQKDTGKYFPELREEINSILQHYQKGASFIHLAPFTQIDAWTTSKDGSEIDRAQINNASLALVGAINSYEHLRVFKNDDAHMFLVTKWDASGKDDIIDSLENVSVVDVESFASNIYTKGFAAFNNLKLDPAQKNLMQYTSGIMSGRDLIKPSPELKAVLNMYPQTMWNWLYGNATNNDPEIGKSLVLLPKPIPPKKSFIDYINDIIHRVLN